MSWKEAAARNAHHLKLALTVEQFTQQLAQLPQTRSVGISDAQLVALAKEREQADRQRQRLEKGEFRIAVVGLEKAGKSTFVNAWLGCDLLPAKSVRCTFTTTQIFSESEAQQRLEIQPKTELQFQDLLSDLKAAVNGPDETRAKHAKQDLDTIQRYAETLKDVLREGTRSKPFSNLNDIRDDLRKYVADERYAHAMQEARLFTCRLAEAEGIVFYDVPGLDSGLAKHIEESRDMLHDCDAVILVQRYPDLRGAEKDLIKFAREGDHHIRLEDKLFVFFGRMDTFATPEAFQRDFQHVQKAWSEEANLAPSRIVAGSAGAHLVLHGMAESETLKDIGDQHKIAEDLRRVTGKKTAKPDELKTLTGIDALKTTLNHYLNNERITIVERRCRALFEQLVQPGETIYTTVRQRYPEDPDEARRRQDEDRTLAFNHWWSARKEKLKADFNEYYSRELSASFNDKTLQNFLKRYQDIIRDGMENLPARAAETRDRKFFSSMQHGFAPETANREWREMLYHDVRRLIDQIAEQLALELENDTQKASHFVTSQLWHSKRVDVLLIGDSKRFQERLQYSLKALFLRYVRPLAEALIRAPVGSQTRMNIVRDSGIDIEILDHYFPDEGEDIYRELKSYLRFGVKLINDPETVKNTFGRTIKNAFGNIPPKTEKLKIALRNATADLDSKGEDAASRRQVIEEVEADMLALEYYLLNSLFDAAGFKAFCQQELGNLRDQFLERLSDGSWDAIANNEWKNGNATMLAELPAELHPQDFNTEVSDRLRQLGTALRQARSLV